MEERLGVQAEEFELNQKDTGEGALSWKRPCAVIFSKHLFSSNMKNDL